MKNLLEQIQSRLEELNKAERKVAEVILRDPQPVSYTHLTLPTIYSV